MKRSTFLILIAGAAAIGFLAVKQTPEPVDDAPATAGADSGSSTAYKKAMDGMMHNMKMSYTGDADVDFAKGMIFHHQGAIDMAKVELQFGKDPEILKLAGEIIKAQESEIAMMNGWLEKHAASAAESDPAAAKAYEQATSSMMSGMMVTPAGDADVDFAKGMIPHHQGAIDMAKVVLQYGDDPEIRALAESIIKAQESEIEFMKEWLVKKGISANEGAPVREQPLSLQNFS